MTAQFTQLLAALNGEEWRVHRDAERRVTTLTCPKCGAVVVVDDKSMVSAAEPRSYLLMQMKVHQVQACGKPAPAPKQIRQRRRSPASLEVFGER